jgi:hypothetical protein
VVVRAAPPLGSGSMVTETSRELPRLVSLIP